MSQNLLKLDFAGIVCTLWRNYAEDHEGFKFSFIALFQKSTDLVILSEVKQIRKNLCNEVEGSVFFDEEYGFFDSAALRSE